MTVADIKEFIDYQITKCTVINDKGNIYYDKIGINNSLEKIKSMLDELEPNEQIKWERDIAIQQLNELGYQFGEKIRSDEE